MAKTRLALIVWLCLAFPVVAAQSKSEPKKAGKPAWSELAPAHQQILAPLATEWNRMHTNTRKKWLAIADRYPKMTLKEQQRLQKRMQDWAQLTPEQRRAAREKYQKLKKLPPDKHQEIKQQWQQYQRSLAQQQQRQGAPLDPSLTDPAEPAPPSETPAAETPVAGTPAPAQ